MSIENTQKQWKWTAKMKKGIRKNKVKWEELEAVKEKYNTDQEFIISMAFPDDGKGELVWRKETRWKKNFTG